MRIRYKLWPHQCSNRKHATLCPTSDDRPFTLYACHPIETTIHTQKYQFWYERTNHFLDQKHQISKQKQKIEATGLK